MIDILNLRDRIEESGYRKSWLAQKLGISNQALWNKLTGKRSFNLEEILMLSKILGLSISDREKIFFNFNVDKLSTLKKTA